MSLNPYESPHGVIGDRPRLTVNRMGRVGFFLSLTGFLALCALPILGALAGTLAFATLPGAIISAVALLQPPRRLAAFGLALGLFGCAYLPTIFQAFMSATAGR